MIYALRMSSSFLSQFKYFSQEKTLRVSIAILVVGLFFILAFLAITLISQSTPDQLQIVDAPEESLQIVQDQALTGDTLECCTVEVAGAVKQPGLYQLSSGSRAGEAIIKAGGFHPNADSNQIAKTINLAKKIDDQEKIYIPFINSDGERREPMTIEAAGGSSKTSINTADQEKLEDLPGIGEVTAKKIITSRPYTSIDDFFQKVKLSSKVSESLRELISL